VIVIIIEDHHQKIKSEKRSAKDLEFLISYLGHHYLLLNLRIFNGFIPVRR